MNLIYGRHPVLEALQSTVDVRQIWVLDTDEPRGALREIIASAERSGIQLHFVPRIALDRKVERANHQGVVAEVGPYRYYTLDYVVQQGADRGEFPFVLILDHIKDVHNFGALLRTAEAAGMHGAVIPERHAAGVTAAVYKTSAGAVNYIPVARVSNIARALQRLSAYGLRLVGMDADGEVAYDKAELGGPLGIVVGEEGRGLSRPVRDACDLVVRLPMHGQIDSLNASVAAGILMYTALQQRSRR